MLRNPQDALSLAATITQYLDLASKLLSEPSVDAGSDENVPITYQDILAAARLLESQQIALDRLSAKTVVKDTPLPGPEALADISHRANQSAFNLSQLFDDLRVFEVNGQFANFQAAISTNWSSSKTQHMLDELQQLRSDLFVNLLIVIRDQTPPPATARDLKENNYQDIHVSGNAVVHLGNVIESSSEANILAAIVTANRTHEQALQSLRKAINTKQIWRSKAEIQNENLNAIREWLRDNSDVPRSIASGLLSTTNHAQFAAIRLKLLDSLSFPEIDSRFHEIADAEKKTFSWIYDSSNPEGPFDHRFGEWLRSSEVTASRLYWISGKPGSGKSTLLRFILRDPRTNTLLDDWCRTTGTKGKLFASCFFWNPGTYLQKSQHGLLRSLLYELLSQSPNFTSSLCPERWRQLEFRAETDRPWTNDELQKAILQFAKECESTIFLIIDGLDEFHGSDEQRLDMCNLFHRLAQMHHVKICASSRPWNVYKDAFQNDPQLRLEDLTREDIRTFVTSQLLDYERNPSFAKAYPHAAKLIENVVSRAQWVFLWVRLITRTLISRMRDGDELEELLLVLSDYPKDLEDFFKRMIADLEPSYRKEAAQLFSVALTRLSNLLTYFYTRENLFPSRSTLQPLTEDRLMNIEQQEERRLNARCKGLLETYRASPILEGKSTIRFETIPLVDFLHRTARDFLLTDTVQKQLTEWMGESNNASVLLFKSAVCCCILSSRQSSSPVFTVQEWFDRYARAITLASAIQKLADRPGMSDLEYHTLIDELRDNFLASLQRLSSTHIRRISPNECDTLWTLNDAFLNNYGSFYLLAGSSGLNSYIIWSTSHSSHFKRLVADYPHFLTRSLSAYSRFGAAEPWKRKCEVVRRLFELGGDPNAMIPRKSKTLWGEWLESLLQAKDFYNRGLDKFDVEVTKLYIEFGAVDVVCESIGSQGRGISPGKRYSKFLRTPDPWGTVRICFDDATAKELTLLLNKSAHNTWSTTTKRFLAIMN